MSESENKAKPVLSREEKRLLRIREDMKSRKPKFTRMNYWLLDRIDEDTYIIEEDGASHI